MIVAGGIKIKINGRMMDHRGVAIFAKRPYGGSIVASSLDEAELNPGLWCEMALNLSLWMEMRNPGIHGFDVLVFRAASYGLRIFSFWLNSHGVVSA